MELGYKNEILVYFAIGIWIDFEISFVTIDLSHLLQVKVDQKHLKFHFCYIQYEITIDTYQDEIRRLKTIVQ